MNNLANIKNEKFTIDSYIQTFLKKSAFFSSLNQNTCPVYDAAEIKKQEQQEAIKKLYP